jgi:hypothetical protein
MEIKLTYFKQSGKYYTSGKYNTNVPPHDVGTDRAIANMYAIADEVESMRSANKLPGLNHGASFFILVDCEDGFPCLLRPVGEQ